jgi:ubiquinone/menaquinone biosynthesis C-methylase UbiE
LLSIHRKQLSDLISRYYTAASKTYDEFAAPTSSLVAARLVELAGIRKGQSVLDLGTGAGIASLLAAAQVGSEGSVLGIDLASGMLSRARRKASAARLRNISLEIMDAARLHLPQGSFDSVISNFGTPIDSFPEVASGVLRVLKENGIFCFSEPTDHSVTHHVVSKAFRKYRTPHPDSHLKKARKLWAEFSELVTRFPLSRLGGLMRKAGFNDVEVLSETFTVPLQDSSTSLSYWIRGEWAEYVAVPSKSRREFKKEALEDLEALAKARRGLQTRTVKFWLGVK